MISNDGATILEKMEILHPAARMVWFFVVSHVSLLIYLMRKMLRLVMVLLL